MLPTIRAEDIEDIFVAARLALEEQRKKARALGDLAYFAHEYANLELGIPPFHAHAYTRVSRHDRTLWLAPVGHGKSTTYGFALPLWLIARDPNVRILLPSKSLARSLEEVGRVREFIESNERYREVFGVQPSEVWKRGQFQVQRTKVLKEATMTAMGVLGNVENWRGDWIIADDIIDIASSISEAERKHVAHWFANTLTKRLDPGGHLAVVGSRWHSQDMYARIEKTGGWDVHIDRAIAEDGSVLWPERWPKAKLLSERDNIPGGVAAFEMRFQNNPIEEAGARWDPEWIHWLAEPPDESVTPIVRRAQGWDLAIAMKRPGTEPDYTACVTLDVLETNEVVLMDAFRFRGDFPAQVQAVQQLAEDWGPDVIAIESNMYQVALPQELVRISNLPIVPSEAKGKKEMRLDALAPHFKSGRIKVWRDARGVEDFVWEFRAFPHGLHDDLLDAFWHAYHELMGKPKKGISIRVRR